MRFLLVGVLVLGACNGDPKHYPVNPGGNGGPPGLGGGVRDPGDDDGGDDGMPVDAPATDPDAGPLPAIFMGRACLITDLRQPRQNCDATNAGMIDVRISGDQRSTDTTNMDGSFMIGMQPNPIRYSLGRADHIATIAPFDNPTNQVMPFVSIVTYATLLGANGLSAGGGAFFIEILDNNLKLAGATVTLNGFITRYDTADALVWGQTSTGPNGVAWIAGIPAGVVTLTVNPNNGDTPKTVMLESFDSDSITHTIVRF